MVALQTVNKSDRELLKVSNFENELNLPGSRLHINMYTTVTIINRSLTGFLTNGGCDGAFTMHLHLIKFLLTSNRWFLMVDGYPSQPTSRMHLVMCIMNTLSFE